jgi:peptide/nickel transport system substrate-binding protein
MEARIPGTTTRARWEGETTTMKCKRWAMLPLALALLLVGCDGRDNSSLSQGSPKGVRRGTLRVIDASDVEAFDPGIAYGVTDLTLLRGVVRELFSFDSSQKGEAALEPVPDLATSYDLSPDGRTYTFHLRPDVQYAPEPGLPTRTVRAADFVYAVERQFDRANPSPNPYNLLIKGAAEFAAGRARTISGMQALDDRTLQITLNQPASDFLSILTLPFFSPVPKEWGSKFTPGDDYAQHVVASGPYMLKTYQRGKWIDLVRNPNWDPQTDPLRSAWVDEIDVQVSTGRSTKDIQQAIEHGDADLNLDLTAPPIDDLRRLSSDPDLSRQLAIETTGCVHYLTLQTDDGPTADVRVRQAINLAVNKEALLLALGGQFAGDVASTILSPTLSGYTRYDLYPTKDNQGDPVQAKALLAAAGYPNGVTVNYVGRSDGTGPGILDAIRPSLAAAGIRLHVTTYKGLAIYTQSLQLEDKRHRHEHQIGQARWCPDIPGNGARSWIGVLLDGRGANPTASNDYGDYNNPEVDRMIDEAYATTDAKARNDLWGKIDRKVMADAPWVPLLYDRQTYFWSSRVKNWTFSPWISNPDITNLWLDPNTP